MANSFTDLKFKLISKAHPFGKPAKGQDIANMVWAYIERLQSDDGTDPDIDNVGVLLDMASLMKVTGFETGTDEADEVWAFYGVNPEPGTLGAGPAKNTLIFLPLVNGQFMNDPDDDTQYLAFESWDPVFSLSDIASKDTLIALFEKSVPSPDQNKENPNTTSDAQDATTSASTE